MEKQGAEGRERSYRKAAVRRATLTTDALQGEQHPRTRDFVRDRFRMVRGHLAERVRAGQQAGMIAADVDPGDAASLVIAASDGLQLQGLLDPEAVDVRRAPTAVATASAIFMSSTALASALGGAAGGVGAAAIGLPHVFSIPAALALAAVAGLAVMARSVPRQHQPA